jgi:hypothetical protein
MGYQAMDISEKPKWGQLQYLRQRTDPRLLAVERVTKEETEALVARMEIMRRMGLCPAKKCGRGDFERCKDPKGCGIA